MATQQSLDTVQKAYIGYYGRPADPAGLEYWADRLDDEGGNLSAIINAFGTSQEYTDRFEGMSNAELVNNLYQQLFNRDVEPEGLDFYVAKLESGESTLADISLDIMNGAQNSDATALANKLAVAKMVTAEIEASGLVYGEHQIDDTVEYLAAVDADTELSDVNVSELTAQFPEPQPENTLFTLTQNSETVVTDNEPTMQLVTYWGYNPHEHGETDVDNIDGYDPDGNDSNLTNEGPSDGGIPLWQLIQTIETTTGLDFAELGLIDAESTTPDLSAVTNLTVDGGDNGSTSTISVTLADGTLNSAEVELAEQYVEYLHDVLFDAEGNSRLFQKEIPLTEYTEIQIDTDGDGVDDTTIVQETYVDPGTTSQVVITPIVLTPSANNGYTVESGQTGDADNTIVAGRLDLLHGAYIDGGEGYNTLEVDAKGHFAQPQELLNIQAVNVQNLPNIYTQNDEGNSSQYPSVEGVDAGDADSILDLSRATDLEVVTITEGNYDGIDAAVAQGDLTVNGVRGNATVVLEGAFSQNVTVHFSEGAENGTNLVLNLGEVTGTLNVMHNSDTLNIDSIGGSSNVLAAGSFGSSTLTNLNVSGEAKLVVPGDLAGSFQSGHPATINATENTAGVDLQIGDNGAAFSDEIVFAGTAEGDDHFTAYSAKSVDIVGGEGDNEFFADTQGSGDLGEITIAAGDGDNEITALADNDEGDISILVGAGDNHITANNQTDEASVTVVAGEGDNDIVVAGDTATITAGNGDNIVNASGSQDSTIVLGTGENTITVTDDGTVEPDTVTIVAGVDGDSDNTIVVEANEEINIATGAGDDNVTINGLADIDGSVPAVTNAAKIVIDLGEGENTLQLGNTTLVEGITAHEDSVITGSDITLVVNQDSNICAATVTGVTGVVLQDSTELTLTVEQLVAIGSENISVVGEKFGATAQINLTVTQDTDLGELIDLAELTKSIDLKITINDGAELELSAEELHKFIIEDGIVEGETTNNDYAPGTLRITDAGLDFDIDAAVAGSVSDDFDVENVTVERSIGGFERPVDAGKADSLVIDTDSATDLAELQALGNLVASQVETLVIEGAANFDFDGSVNLADGFTIDLSGLTGELNELTITQFEKIAGETDNTDGLNAINADDVAGWGEIIGNGNINRINIEVSTGSQTGYNDITKGGFKSSGVQTYVVTDILDANGDKQSQAAGGTATIYVCDNTEDLETIGLQNNRNATVTFENVNWNTTILLEGDGYANSSEQEKNLGNPDESEVGAIVVNYFEAGANATVNLNNQGVALGMNEDAEDGFDATGERVLVAEGITVTNADRLAINVEDGNAIIESITAVDAERINVTSADDVTVRIAAAGIDTNDLVSIDGTGVAGTFTLNLTNGAYDFSGVSLTGIDALVLGDDVNAVTLTLTAAQVIELKDVIADSDSATTLNVVELTDEALDLTDLDVDAIAAVTFADVDGTITVNAEANFDEATSLNIVADDSDTTVEMTLAQFDTTTDGTVTVSEANGDDATLTLTAIQNDSEIDLQNVDAAADVIVRIEDVVATEDFDLQNAGTPASVNIEVAGGTNDLTEATGIDANVEGFNFTADSTLTLTAAQLAAIGLDDADGDGVADNFTVADGVTVTLNVSDLSTQALDLDLLEAAGITIGTITIENTDAAITIAAGTTFGNAVEIVTPTADDDDTVLGVEDTTVTMTADQFAGLSGIGTISGDAEINLTGLANNADSDDADLDADNLEIDLSGITAPHGTVSLADSVELNALSDLGSFEIILADGQIISFATEAQASGTTVTETGVGANTAIAWLFDAIAAQIDTSNYDADINTLFVNEDLVDGANIEELWNTLESSINVEVVNSSDIPDVLISFNRTVVVEALTGLDSITIDDQNEFQTVENLTVNLEGNTSVGNIIIDDTVGEGTFNALVINSYEDRSTLENDNDFGFQPNIVGDISLSATPSNELVNITLNTYNSAADEALGGGDVAGAPTADGGFYDAANGEHANAERKGLELEVGTITFGSDGPDGFSGEATLTLEGAENITITALDTSDAEITVVHVDNNNTGTVTIAGVAHAQDNIYYVDGFVAETGDITTLNDVGNNLLVVTNGDNDLTEATIDVDAVEFTADATLTMTAAQVLAIGTASTDGVADAWSVANGATVTLNITDLGTQALDLDAIEAAGINIGTITTDDATFTLDAATTLGDADSFVIELDDTDNTVTMTAAQYQTINAGNISETDTDDTNTNTASVVITDLADIEDATSGLVNIDLSTVNVTGTQRVELDDANSANVDVTLDAAADLGGFTVVLMSQSTALNTLSGQTIRFATEEQASRAIDVLTNADGDTDAAGTAIAAGQDEGTNVVWLFDTVTGQVDTAEYDAQLGRVWILDTLADGANIEELYTDLADSIIVRIENSTVLSSTLLTDGFSRVVEIEGYTDLPNGLTFNDIDTTAQTALDFVENLTITMGGSVDLGDLTISNVLANPIDNDDEFDTLTINSTSPAADPTYYLLPELQDGQTWGNNSGQVPLPTSANTIGDIASGSADFDLANVVVHTQTGGNTNAITIGTITFSEDGDLTVDADSNADFTAQGDSNVTVKSLDTSDTDITSLTITNNLNAATLTVTGGSPAVDGGDGAGNTETVTIATVLNATTTLGSTDADDGTVYAGVYGEELSDLVLTGAGDVNLGVIADVDTEDFTLDATGSTGDITLTLGEADANGLKSPELSATGTWVFDFTGAGTVDVTITEDVTFVAGSTLTLTAVDTLNFEGDVDLSVLGDGLTLSGNIVLPEGATLTLTAAQADAFAGTITGAGDVVITELEATPAADLSNFMTSTGDTGTVTAQLDSTGDVTLTAQLGVAAVEITGTGTVDATGATIALFDRTVAGGATDSEKDLASFTVATGSTLLLDADDVGIIDATATNEWQLLVSGAGATNVDSLNANNDLSSITTTTVTASADASITFTGDLGTAVVTVEDGVTLTTTFDIATGHEFNEEAAPAGTGALVVELDATNAAADLTTLTGDLTAITASIVETQTFVGDFDGAAVVIDHDTVAASVDLTVAADLIDGLSVEGAGNGTENLIITDLATNLAVDLSLVDVASNLAAATAAFDADGTFTGDLGTVTVTIADGVLMTAAASILAGADVNKSSAVGTGGVVATLSNAIADDASVNLNTIAGGATGTAANVDSITVLDDLTFTGTLHTTVPVQVADGATLSVTSTVAHNAVLNKEGTTGEVAVDSVGDATLIGSADFTVTGVDGDDIDASMVSGDLDVTLEDADSDITVGGGTNTINADALDGNTLTLIGTSTDTAEVSTVTFTAPFVADDVINLYINGTVYTHTVVSTAVADIADAFDALINGIDADVTSAAAAGVLTLTAINAGEEIIVTSETDSAAGTAPVAETVGHTIATAATTVTTIDGDIDATGVTDADADSTTGGVTITAGAGTNTLDGSANDDVIDGGDGVDTIDGRDGDDRIVGGADDDTLTGGAGADIFEIDADLDTVTDFNGGDGDTFVITNAADADITVEDHVFSGTAVTNSSNTSAGTVTLTYDPTNNPSSVGVGADFDLTGIGGSAGYTIVGNTSSDRIVGSAFADNIQGGGGADRLDGGNGADTLDGGAGNDTFVVDAAADVQSGDTFTGGNDSDTIEVSTTDAVNFSGATINVDVENLDLTPVAADVTLSVAQLDHLGMVAGLGTLDADSDDTVTIQGTTGADTIDLSEVDDPSNGSEDADYVVVGGSGADTITLLDEGTGQVTVEFASSAAGNGNDTITNFDAGNSGDVLDFSNMSLVGTGAYALANAGSDAFADAEVIALTATGNDIVTDANTDIDTTGDVTGDTVILYENGGVTEIYLYEDNANAAAIEIGELTLIGTVDVADTATFVAGNFA